jgi:4-hydroxy-4-methyl-2-oxoglutarate aldolase
MRFSRDENQELIRLYEGLRVADVRDGMDWMMMHHRGSMSPGIRPLFRTRAAGIARTCRYLPYDEPIPAMTPKEYSEWVSWYYGHVCTYPWMDEIEPGDFCVIDQCGVDAGLMGSNNSLGGVKSGARGYVTNGGVRDTDEIILEKVPFWPAFISQSMVQGRLRFDNMDMAVSVGGVVVNPGDVVVGDGDGIIVVPRTAARDVAKYARHELEQDKVGRRKLYKDLGLPPDESVADAPNPK